MVDDVPYVTSTKEIKRAALISSLCLAGEKTHRPDTHVVKFTGEHPCSKTGSPLNIANQENLNTRFNDDLTIRFEFSQKPHVGYYTDYYQKMIAYVKILLNEAQALDPEVSATRFLPIQSGCEDSAFVYHDTASSRSNIQHAVDRFKSHRVALVGMGGTGAYVLDFLSKTPIREIHIFDGDLFLTHNAFRAPGAAPLDALTQSMSKVEYYRNIYGNMHRHIVAHFENVTPDNIDILLENDFVFLCIDKNSAKQIIIEKLGAAGKPFVDCGMGLFVTPDGAISGSVRVTTGAPGAMSHIEKRVGWVDGANVENDEYKSNIQIAELNALNAVLAVVKWKKALGFYNDDEREMHCVYAIGGNELINEDQCEKTAQTAP